MFSIADMCLWSLVFFGYGLGLLDMVPDLFGYGSWAFGTLPFMDMVSGVLGYGPGAFWIWPKWFLGMVMGLLVWS